MFHLMGINHGEKILYISPWATKVLQMEGHQLFASTRPFIAKLQSMDRTINWYISTEAVGMKTFRSHITPEAARKIDDSLSQKQKQKWKIWQLFKKGR